MISQDVANRLSIKIGDKIAYYVIPSDSVLCLNSVEIVGVIPERDISANSFITNSEYVQGAIGRDFDIDVMSLLTKPSGMSQSEWNSLMYQLTQVYPNYINGIYETFKKVFQKIPTSFVSKLYTKKQKKLINDKKDIERKKAIDEKAQVCIYSSKFSCLNTGNQKLANGLYFFQIEASQNGKTVSKVGRMVIKK